MDYFTERCKSNVNHKSETEKDSNRTKIQIDFFALYHNH